MLITSYSIKAANKINSKGFTIMELLVVVAILAILASLLLSSLNRAYGKSKAAACQNNLKQLQTCYMMYIEDNQQYLPDNSVDHMNAGQHAWIQGNVQQYSANYTNDVSAGVLYGYNKSPAIYRCPASKAFIRDLRNNPVQHNRSYSISVWLNCSNVTGIQKANQMSRPSSVSVFLEENAISIDNGAIGISMASNPWYYWNLPSNRHNRGCNITFGDGHTEYFHWLGRYLNSYNSTFGADDSRSQRPDPALNPTNPLESDEADVDLIRLSGTVPIK